MMIGVDFLTINVSVYVSLTAVYVNKMSMRFTLSKDTQNEETPRKEC